MVDKKDKLVVPSDKDINIKGNLRRMVKKDLSAVMNLYNNKHSQFKLYQHMSNEELLQFL